MAPARPESDSSAGEAGSRPPPTRHDFDRAFRAADRGHKLFEALYAEAFGGEALSGADPYSFIAKSELAWLVAAAGLGPGRIFLDLGCGRGGPGAAAAADSGARLVGVDFSIVGVHAAQLRTVTAAGYVAGDARVLPFGAGSFEAVLSIDVVQLIPDREQVFREIARVLRKGGVFAFSSWELTVDPATVPPRLARQPRDLAGELERSGLAVESIEEPAAASQREASYWALVVRSAGLLRRELGDEAADRVLEEASLEDAFSRSTRRVLGASRRL